MRSWAARSVESAVKLASYLQQWERLQVARSLHVEIDREQTPGFDDDFLGKLAGRLLASGHQCAA